MDFGPLSQPSILYPGRVECKSGMTSISIAVTDAVAKTVQNMTTSEMKAAFYHAGLFYKQARENKSVHDNLSYFVAMFVDDWVIRYEKTGPTKDYSFAVYLDVAAKLKSSWIDE